MNHLIWQGEKHVYPIEVRLIESNKFWNQDNCPFFAYSVRRSLQWIFVLLCIGVIARMGLGSMIQKALYLCKPKKVWMNPTVRREAHSAGAKEMIPVYMQAIAIITVLLFIQKRLGPTLNSGMASNKVFGQMAVATLSLRLSQIGQVQDAFQKQLLQQQARSAHKSSHTANESNDFSTGDVVFCS